MHPCLGAVSIHHSPTKIRYVPGFIAVQRNTVAGSVNAVDIVQIRVHCSGMHVETFSHARNNLKAVMDRVVADSAPVKITRQRGQSVVMVSESDWDSIEETLYLLSSPRNAERLLGAIERLSAGEGEAHELIDP